MGWAQAPRLRSWGQFKQARVMLTQGALVES